ncbi:hypothetical protein GZ77_15340 [Endozoicomonas montiporae]|uniref:Calcineurin-like phosphoesterase domain-containing protein n=2 Tax=Endozoicomonas montiporae TaxID=1027273 RepID=A0A081N5F4_9GAMM|nr:metallophosphoesterase [Endozoicomonas montiporae]AMO57439.1 serine/threonine protein phosphatase 1 [Endozoicomonas montiporae CL-33]KEQ13677.1 hypothetical protein GZ77_15340 [Endozoicomonas montiporae]
MFHQFYTANQEGRDFAIGDLHGMYDLLFEELDQVDFDFTNDRCFSVGDLIDRGAKSEQCLGLINEPWFHPVCGNHEDTLRKVARSLSSAATTADWILNGGRWHLMVSTQKMHDYADLVDTLPELISVATPSGKLIALCHAEYPLPYWAPDEIANDDELRRQLMWSRQKVRSQNHSTVSGIDSIICGHTIVDQPQQLGNSFYIDTGAFESKTLTLVNLETL